MPIPEDIEKMHYDSLKGSNKHYCPEWDFMAIDETCPEYEACRCSIKTSKVTEENK